MQAGAFLGAVLACVALAGCAGIGPRSIGVQRSSYTQVLAATNREELVANIVRLKFVEPPVFLSVHSVTSSPSLAASMGAQASFERESSRRLNLPADVSYQDRPTIVYSPLGGEAFANQFMAPISAPAAFLMLDNGFEFDLLAQLFIEELNGVRNARDASSSERAKFRCVVEALDRLRDRGMVRFETTAADDSQDPLLQVRFETGAFDTDDGRLVAERLGLDANRDQFAVLAGGRARSDALVVKLRSLLSVLSLLSSYVEAPANSPGVAWPADPTSEPLPLLRIRASRARPTAVESSAFLHGYWWYVGPDDLRSHNTLYVVQLLMDLQAQAVSDSNAVQLTLPVR
jgi:hypothetical protein